ncbi:MAG: hypothetical protein D6731_09140 [Planctomycetota bacterium]|nr:MAG: hypothetical protein D6731_09140 [Planctomycetota bacterium]
MRSTPWCFLLGSAFLVALGQAGCGHGSGRRVVAGENLRIDNRSARVHDVFVDGGRLGDIDPGVELKYELFAGFHTVHLREDGDTFLELKADFRFAGDTVLAIRHEDPLAPPENFEFVNRDSDRVHVYVDGAEVGVLSFGAVRTFQVASGKHAIGLREDGEAFVTDYGDLVFAAGTVVRIEYDD